MYDGLDDICCELYPVLFFLYLLIHLRLSFLLLDLDSEHGLNCTINHYVKGS